jgi:hypothetical protein
MRFEYKSVPEWPWLAWPDVLSGGLFVTSKRLELLKSRDIKNIPNELLQDRNDETLRALLTPGCMPGLAAKRQSAICKRKSKTPSILQPPSALSFFATGHRPWSPYTLLGSLPKVFSPYLDHDLFDFLVSLIGK